MHRSKLKVMMQIVHGLKNMALKDSIILNNKINKTAKH